MHDSSRCVRQTPYSVDGFASLSIPVERASTILFPDVDSYTNRGQRKPDGYSYGLGGTPTTKALEARLAALEGAEGVTLVPSGQAAITIPMLAVLSPGDHVLITDATYPPVRSFASEVLNHFGCTVDYYDPMIGSDIAALIRHNTRLIWTESPGSSTMEIQDIPAIVAAAHARDVLVGCDNTWASPLFLKPLSLGVDLSVQALTKYVGGHSDLLMGSIATRDRALHARIKDMTSKLGIGVSPDDCFLALRGLETMSVRLRHMEAVALDLANWLKSCPQIDSVLHPALEDAPGHEYWRRDFAGSSGVFSIIVRSKLTEALKTAINGMKFFSIGASWGGVHSLIVPMDVTAQRTAVPWRNEGTLLRISIGLEDPRDLKGDLEQLLQGL